MTSLETAPPPRVKIATYAAVNMPLSALGLPIATYLPAFFSQSIGIDLTAVGAAFVIVRLWDVAADPLIGAAMDRYDFARKHKVWILSALPALMLAIGLVFFAQPGMSQWQLIATMMLFYSAYSIYEVAHQSWGRTLTRVPETLTSLYGWREILGMAAMVLMLVIPAGLQILDSTTTLQERVAAMGMFALCILPIVTLLAVLRLPDREGGAVQHLDWRKAIRATVETPGLLRILGVSFLAGWSAGAVGALFLFFLDHALDLSRLSSPIMLLYFVAGIAGMGLWMTLTKRMAKSRVMAIMAGYAAFIHLTYLFLPPGSLVITLSLTIALGLGFGAQFLMRTILADLVDADAEKAGADRTATLFAWLPLSGKLGQTAAVGLMFPLLQWRGFDPQADVQTQSGLEALRFLFAAAPALGMAMMMLLLLTWQRTKAPT